MGNEKTFYVDRTRGNGVMKYENKYIGYLVDMDMKDGLDNREENTRKEHESKLLPMSSTYGKLVYMMPKISVHFPGALKLRAPMSSSCHKIVRS